MEKIILILYAVLMMFIFGYSVMQLHLAFLYLRHRKKNKKSEVSLETNIALNFAELPYVTVQLPVYNELYVIERLLEAVGNFNYPKDKLEIQVLDDSTDVTVSIVASKIKQLKNTGIDIIQIRRSIRTGYKAGALAHGLNSAKGEFIAIFDADFIPAADFILKTIPLFKDENIGVVQTRWAHLNEKYSLLTRMQAFGLNAHFSVEQQGRNAGGHFINFNGTAGIWRKKCIEDAGGWKSDTLTEDLDLSYRAQLKNWKFIYLENLGSPAELPLTMSALKTQQFRWSKGAAECTRKNLRKVLSTNYLPLSTKTHAVFHLMNSFVFICITLTAVLSVPVLIIKNSISGNENFFKYSPAFFLCFVLLAFFYLVSELSNTKNKSLTLVRFLFRYPAFLSISMGLSLHNAIAVWEGYAGKKTPFIRTPKFNIGAKNESWQSNKYLISAINPVAVMEGVLAIYFLAGIFLAFHYHDYGLLLFHVMLSFGFGTVCYYSFAHSRSLRKKNE